MASIVEQEYTTARSSNIPVLAFFIDETFPWPPQHIQWERRAELAAFKAKVKAEVVIKSFTTPDHLAALASQALATFRERRQRASSVLSAPGRITLRADSSADLKLRPDLTIQIGRAEDDLPLLLGIRRSRDLTVHFEAILETIRRPHIMSSDGDLGAFRQSIEEYAKNVWASDGIEVVRMLNGSEEELFVTSSTPLSSLFQSSLDAILSPGKRPGTHRGDLKGKTVPGAAQDAKPLQSEGGSNRFLGVSIKDGRAYSVGRPRDHYGGYGAGWIEWRPFLYTSPFPVTSPTPGFLFLVRSHEKGTQSLTINISKHYLLCQSYSQARNQSPQWL